MHSTSETLWDLNFRFSNGLNFAAIIEVFFLCNKMFLLIVEGNISFNIVLKKVDLIIQILVLSSHN